MTFRLSKDRGLARGFMVRIIILPFISAFDTIHSSMRTDFIWLGNMFEFVLGLPAGRTEIGWFAKYGSLLKFHACFGVCRLHHFSLILLREDQFLVTIYYRKNA